MSTTAVDRAWRPPAAARICSRRPRASSPTAATAARRRPRSRGRPASPSRSSTATSRRSATSISRRSSTSGRRRARAGSRRSADRPTSAPRSRRSARDTSPCARRKLQLAELWVQALARGVGGSGAAQGSCAAHARGARLRRRPDPRRPGGGRRSSPSATPTPKRGSCSRAAILGMVGRRIGLLDDTEAQPTIRQARLALADCLRRVCAPGTSACRPRLSPRKGSLTSRDRVGGGQTPLLAAAHRQVRVDRHAPPSRGEQSEAVAQR